MCSNNLASLGASLVSFAELNPDRRFPSLDLQGPFAFAGSYAIRLNDIALIDRQDVLWCPSLTPTIGYRVQLPSEQQVRDAAPYRLQQWKQTAGGTYAYNLGFFY